MYHLDDVRDVTALTRALISFIFIGMAAVAVAVLAHVVPPHV